MAKPLKKLESKEDENLRRMLNTPPKPHKAKPSTEAPLKKCKPAGAGEH